MRNQKAFDPSHAEADAASRATAHVPVALLTEVGQLDFGDFELELTAAELEDDLRYGRPD